MNNHFKHGIGRYLLQLVDKYLGNETPGFEFQRPKKVTNLLDTFVLGMIFKLLKLKVNPARFLQYGIFYLEMHLLMNIPEVIDHQYC